MATQLTEMGIPLDVIAAVIGHEAGGREACTLVPHYVRTDLVERKRSVLVAWDRFLADLIHGKIGGGNVTAFADLKLVANGIGP